MMPPHARRLEVLYESIDQRVHATHAARAQGDAWPCSKGCDGCCSKLHEVPRITAAEWARLEDAIRKVPEHHPLFAARMRDLAAANEPGHVVCPFLAPEDGAPRLGSCTVYEGRPTACRTYGYYAERGILLGCDAILSYPHQASAVWGNQVAVDRELDALCTETEPRRSFVDWWQRSSLRG